MVIKELNIKGVFEIQLQAKEDHRGFFMTTYDDKIFSEYKIHEKWVQENHSFSKNKGVLRGLHFQLPPNAQAKLFRVISGELYYAFVDLRNNSKSFGKWESAILSAKSKKMIYVPRGFAVGSCSIVKNSSMVYKVSHYYTPSFEYQIRWDDPDLNINWPKEIKPILSEKDFNAKSFKEFISDCGPLEV